MIFLSENIIFEIKLSDLQKRYPKIQDDILNQIFKADPTEGKYAGWLAKIYSLNNLRLEDLYKATEYLEIYDKVKNKLPAQYRDINRLKKEKVKYIDDYDNKEKEKVIKTPIIPSLQDLYQLIKPFQEKDEHLTTNEKIEKDNLIAKIGDWKIYVPKTHEASCQLGSGTQWCTAIDNGDQETYQSYMQKGPLYILIKTHVNDKTGGKRYEKYQFHFETKQFMDKDDVSVYLSEFFKENPKLRQFFNSEKASFLDEFFNAINLKIKTFNNITVSIFNGISDLLELLDEHLYKIYENALSDNPNINHYSLKEYFNEFSPQKFINHVNENNAAKLKLILERENNETEKMTLNDAIASNKKILNDLKEIFYNAELKTLNAVAKSQLFSLIEESLSFKKLEKHGDKYVGIFTENDKMGIFALIYDAKLLQYGEIYNVDDEYYEISENYKLLYKNLNDLLYDYIGF